LRQHSANQSLETDLLLHDLSCVARRHNVPVDLARHLRWAAWQPLGDGRRLAAARCYLRAVRRGDMKSLGRAIVALLGARPITRRQMTVDPLWAREADAWLSNLRSSA